MSFDNICKFIPTTNPNGTINTINFVIERHISHVEHVSAVYGIYLIINGTGTFSTLQRDYDVKPGDVLFVFAGKKYCLDLAGDMEYMYITFVGNRVEELLKRANVAYSSPCYRASEYLTDFWKNSLLTSNDVNLDLICECVVMYTLAQIVAQKDEKPAPAPSSNVIMQIKAYLDEHYTDPSINLTSVCSKFSYNPKYISHQFKKVVKISFSNYISELRMNHAKVLMENNYESISEISHLCGFSDSMYFSKLFKEKHGISPKKYIMANKKV